MDVYHVGTDLPSLNAVRMFEAAARCQNFTKAAELLCVTQSAVSRQVKLLEGQLGEDLFHRAGPRLTLTDAGELFYAAVASGLVEIRRGVSAVRQMNVKPTLTISVLPSFAAKWLVPRVARFQASHNDFEIRIATSYEAIDFSQHPDVDMAVRQGTGSWRGTYAECLLTERLFPVCSPKFLSKHGPIRRPEQLCRLPLIRATEKYDQWDDWFEKAGVSARPEAAGPRYSDSLVIQQAALESQGVALGRGMIAADEISSGRLIQLFDTSVRASWSLYFVCPEGREKKDQVRVFLDWLRSEAATSDGACENLFADGQSPKRICAAR